MTPRRVATWACALLALSASESPRLLAQDRPAASTAVVVQRYAAGQYEAVAQGLRARLSSRQILKSFVDEAKVETRHLSRENAAGLLLEASIAALPVDETLSIDLLELGCARLKAGPRDEFEHQWHLTAIAWLQGPGPFSTNLRTLFGANDEVQDATVTRGDDFVNFPTSLSHATGHLRHARDRFPEDLDLQFTETVATLRRHYNFLYLGNVIRQAPAQPLARTSTRYAVADYPQIVTKLRDLSSRGTDAQKARALLYLGFLRYYTNHTEDAQDLWARAERLSPDHQVQYLARLFQARAVWGQSGGVKEAVSLLIEASALYPSAQTAKRMLAAFLFLAGDTAHAGQIAEETLTMPAGDDPWWTFLRGDYVHFPERLALMRAGLK